MPPAIGAALAAGAVAGAGAAIGGVAIGSLGILGSALVIGGSTAALNLAESVLSPQPRMPVLPDFAGRERGITQLVRGSVEASRVIYGERIVSGVLVFAETTGDAREHLHLVIALPGHEVEAIGDVWVNDEPVRAPDGAGHVADGHLFNIMQPQGIALGRRKSFRRNLPKPLPTFCLNGTLGRFRQPGRD